MKMNLRWHFVFYMKNKIIAILILILSSLFFSCAGNIVKQENTYAMKMMGKGILKEAEFRFRQQIAEDPDNWAAHNNLGVCLEEQGFHKEALAEYETALSIIGANKGVEYNYNNLLEELKDE